MTDTAEHRIIASDNFDNGLGVRRTRWLCACGLRSKWLTDVKARKEFDAHYNAEMGIVVHPRFNHPIDHVCPHGWPKQEDGSTACPDCNRSYDGIPF